MPLGLSLLAPASLLLGGCVIVETNSSGGGGASTTTTSTTGTGGTTTTPTGGTGGETGGTGGTTGGTGGTTGGTGGTTMTGPPANDLCPGQDVTLALDSKVDLPGTLQGATDDYTTNCADSSPDPGNPDVVYQLTIADAATVTISIDATGFVPALSFRKQECSQRLGGDLCLDLGTGTVSKTLGLPAGTYWVVVDSADGNVGDFNISFDVATPKCGDGVVNVGEQCDPAVVKNDDGCINPGDPNACHYGEAPPDPAIVACDGGLVPVGPNDPFVLGPYNNGSGGYSEKNVAAAGSSCEYQATGPENVFHVIPTADGMLTLQIGYAENGTTLYCTANPMDCADFVMYLRTNMCNSAAAGDQVACADYTVDPMSPFGFDEVLTIKQQVTANTDYWLVVQGIDSMYGVGGYYLSFDLQ
ncbi:MAG: hypothetical protein U0441_33130 [Polyangiaceae bacterium]